MQETKAEEEEGKGEVPGHLGSPGGQHEGKRKESKRETREKGRKTARTTAGGPVSESGCGGLSASTEPDEGCSSFTMRQVPPLVGVHERRGCNRPVQAKCRQVGVQVPIGGRKAPQ